MPLQFLHPRRRALIFFMPDAGAPSGGAPAEEPAARSNGILRLSDLRAAFTSRTALGSRITELSSRVTELETTNASLIRERDEARAQADTERTRANGLQAQLEDGQRQIDELLGSAATVSEKTREELNKLGVSAAQLPKSADIGAAGSIDDQIKSVQAQMATADPKQKYKLVQQIRALRATSKAK